jgi:putative transposase
VAAEELWQEEARKLCKLHVTYGYRRIRVLLKRAGHEVGIHKVRRWMRECGLAQSGPVKDEGRTPGEKPADPTAPNQAWQIDATKIYTKLDGWAWQTSILDVYDRRIVAHVVRKTCRAADAMDVLAMALDRYTATGRSETKIKRGSGWASLSDGLFTISERTRASHFCRWPVRVA